MRRIFVAALLALNAACGTLSTATAACGPGGDSDGELEIDGRDRSYDVYVPTSAPEKGRVMIVGLHGGFGTGDIFAKQAGLKAAADRHGFVLLLPDGYWRSWNAGSCCGAAKKKGIDDVAFIKALIPKVAADYCVNTKKVGATGFSNGAMLIHRLRCEAPGLLAAIAPVSGGPMVSECKAAQATPALLIQGRDDPRIFWDGGTFDDSYRPSMNEVVAMLSGPNRCAESSTKALAGNAGCASRTCTAAGLTWCGVSKVGHQWPGGESYFEGKLGPNRQDVDATHMIFDFFAEQFGAQ